MDNASFHRNSYYRREVLKARVEVFYIAPYTSVTNPIEFYFGRMKNYLKGRKIKTNQDLNKIVKEYFQEKKNKFYSYSFIQSFEMLNSLVKCLIE